MITRNEIKLVRSLSDKSSREQHGLFVVEGDKMVGEALESGYAVEKIYVAAKSIYVGHEQTLPVSDSEMERMSHMKTPPHSLALICMPDPGFASFDIKKGLIMALDDIQDPGNLGTIIRLANWFGIKDIVCSRATADCFNPKVVQATMGAIFRVRLSYTDLAEALSQLSREGMTVYGTFLDGENIYESELSADGVVVMGNEGRGISDMVAELIDRKLFIPPYCPGSGGSESLNVSTAAAIVCSEFRRRGY